MSTTLKPDVTMQLRALDDLDGLRARVDSVRAQTGRVPETWAAVVAAGLLDAVPTDPTGAPYVLGADGSVTLAAASALNPLPTLEAR